MSDTPIADDLLRGVKPIAAFLGENQRRTFYLLEKRLIPCGKIVSYPLLPGERKQHAARSARKASVDHDGCGRTASAEPAERGGTAPVIGKADAVRAH